MNTPFQYLEWTLKAHSKCHYISSNIKPSGVYLKESWNKHVSSLNLKGELTLHSLKITATKHPKKS